MSAATEVLPPGVGRVPQWWLDLTPHYTLDEDDNDNNNNQEERRQEEDRVAYYGMQLEAAHAAGVLNPDGTPKLGPDLRPLTWTPWNPWNTLTTNTTTTTGGPGGRNFSPGQPVMNPQLFGIAETDPNYQAYLTGAKLPPGYFEIMGQMMATAENGGTTEGILNNLKQTDYGRYGHQAENPRFKPAWVKKKLRSTNVGTSIRQGHYDDSPNKHTRPQRRINPEDVGSQLPAPPAILHGSSSDNHITASTTDHHATATASVADYHDNHEDDDDEELLRQQQERLLQLQQLQRQLQQQKEREEQQQQQQQQQHARVEQARPQQLVSARSSSTFQIENPFDQVVVVASEPNAHGAASMANHQPEQEEMMEEVFDEEEMEDFSYEEEIIDDDDDDGELDDLQAILAAKQAELQLLQAQL